MLQFGKKQARPGAIRLGFKDVFDVSKLPTPPMKMGHYDPAKSDWGMLANDKYGCCVWSGGAHETMIFRAEGGIPAVPFDDACTLINYASTGFDPAKPDTDQGTDMQAAAAYRQKTGLIDADGNYHKTYAYANIMPGNFTEIDASVYIFGAAGIGVRCPSSMMRQFNGNEIWSVVAGDTVDDGHYIPCVGRTEDGLYVLVSWGRYQLATREWLATYMDEGVAYLSLEILNNSTKLSPESFNTDVLSAYVKDFS